MRQAARRLRHQFPSLCLGGWIAFWAIIPLWLGSAIRPSSLLIILEGGAMVEFHLWDGAFGFESWLFNITADLPGQDFRAWHISPTVHESTAFTADFRSAWGLDSAVDRDERSIWIAWWLAFAVVWLGVSLVGFIVQLTANS